MPPRKEYSWKPRPEASQAGGSGTRLPLGSFLSVAVSLDGAKAGNQRDMLSTKEKERNDERFGEKDACTKPSGVSSQCHPVPEGFGSCQFEMLRTISTRVRLYQVV